MKRQKLYSGQAIAIVMVVLVVAAVLGASLYSRTIKNQQSSTNIQDSDIALEQVDSILNLFSEADIEALDDAITAGSGSVSYEDLDDLMVAGAFSPIAQDVVDQLQSSDTWCADGASGLKVEISRMPDSEYIDVGIGNTRAYVFEGASITGTPSLDLNIQARGYDHPSFVVKKIYRDVDTGDFKAYSIDDSQAYCLGADSADCNADITPSTSLTATQGPISIGLSNSGIYEIYEVRVIPLIGSIAVNHNLVGMSGVEFGYIKVRASVNCYGKPREKELVIPGSASLSYATTFDYVLYNNGSLSPN